MKIDLIIDRTIELSGGRVYLEAAISELRQATEIVGCKPLNLFLEELGDRIQEALDEQT